MANEATIDELQIEISTTSGSAADNLEKLAQKLERLEAAVQPLTANSGLEKIAKQLDKLSAVSSKLEQMSGFEKIGRAVEQLKKLNELNSIGDISGFVRNLNKLPQAVNAIAQMPSMDATKFRQLADALKPLEKISAGNINSTLNSLRKIPKISQELAGVDFTQLTQQIQQISTAMEPLVRQAERGGAGLTALAQIMQRTNRTAQQNTRGFSLFNQTIGDIKVKTLAAIAGLRRLFSALKNGISASAAYVENLNLFSVTMGDSADEALRFAENVNAALGVDTSDWIRYQGVFQSIGKGFGIVSSQADVMSKNLTQLSYDISSFYNITADVAAEKLQSALSGQIMPMRQLGFAIEETTLKQVALNHGITASVESMTQAQKAQLRYVAIMEQAGNIGVLGDMARTIDTASNGMRVLEARIQQFSRAIGNMLMPWLSAVLPYMTAFVQVLTEGAQAIANFFGFELPKIDFSDAQISSGFNDITGAIDEATEASEAFKGSLSSIDQLNIIGSENENKIAAADNQFDLGINLPEYDFLQGVESKTKQIADNIKDWFKEALPWIEAVGAAIGAVFVTSKIGKFVDFLGGTKDLMVTIGNLVSGKFGKTAQVFSGIAGGLAAGASSGILFYNGIKNLITGTGKLEKNIAQIGVGLGISATAIALFVKNSNPIGVVITTIGALTGVIAGSISGMKELDAEMSNTITYAENGGISIQGLADGFMGYFDEITSHYDDVLANTRAFENNQSKISGAASEIHNLTEKYGALDGAMTEEDALTLSNNIKMIGDSIRTNLNTATADLVKTLTERFGKFAENADELAGSLYLLQSMGNTTLADLQKHADELAIEISTGDLSSDDRQKKLSELEDTVQKMYGGTINATTESIGFEQALKNMDVAKINLESPENVEAAITEIDSKAKAAIESLENARNGQLLELQDLKGKYISWGLDKQFGEEAFATVFDEWEKALNIGYDSEISKVNTGENVFLAMLQQQLDKNSKRYVSDKIGAGIQNPGNFFQDFGIFFKSMTRRDDIPGNEFYNQQVEDFTKEYQEQHSAIFDLIDQAANGVDLTQFYDDGKFLMQGMENGAIDGAKSFYSTISDIDKKITDTVETDMEIGSPSKVFYRIGDYLMQGLANGIFGGQNLVFEALDYIAIQSIMKLSKLKESISAGIVDVNPNKLIPDFSFKTPTVAPISFGQQTGTAREAYEKSNIATSGSYDSGNLEATVPVTVQVFLENDMIMESVSEQFANASYRNNGKPLW